MEGVFVDPDAYTSRAAEVRQIAQAIDHVKDAEAKKLLRSCMAKLIETMTNPTAASVPFMKVTKI